MKKTIKSVAFVMALLITMMLFTACPKQEETSQPDSGSVNDKICFISGIGSISLVAVFIRLIAVRITIAGHVRIISVHNAECCISRSIISRCRFRTNYLHSNEFIVSLIDEGVDFVLKQKTYDEKNRYDGGDDDRIMIIALHQLLADSDAAHHAGRSADQRQNQKRLDMHIGDARSIRTQILWDAGNQEDDKYEDHALFAVEFIEHLGDLAFPEQRMHRILAQELSNIKDSDRAEKSPEDRQRKGQPETVQVSGGNLQRLSRNNTDDDLHDLCADVNQGALCLVLQQPAFHITNTGEIL